MSIITLALVIIEPTPIMRLLPEINIIISRKEIYFSTRLNITRGNPSYSLLCYSGIRFSWTYIYSAVTTKNKHNHKSGKNLFNLKVYYYSWEIYIVSSFCWTWFESRSTANLGFLVIFLAESKSPNTSHLLQTQ